MVLGEKFFASAADAASVLPFRFAAAFKIQFHLFLTPDIFGAMAIQRAYFREISKY